ncbi:MarR family winged helix-turn-helix transcriptional regulator [Raoultibacter timonensis]|uniref:MarR family winged helix-turn-helix transcriptional regulator n=1 Tax=Raoultibacter timonensis TaxID=1907662 RepID=UPI000C832A64|nr:MarR family winged helix-turn-helix transcriptional regulator [Raoultibacter timonensis]
MDRFGQHIDNMYEDFFHMDYLYGEFAKRYGESYYSMSVLFVLGENPEGISQKSLCAELFLPKQTISSIVGTFERRGLATHRTDEADKRSKLHVLTAEGKRRCDEIMGDLRGIELRCAHEIGEDDMIRAHEISKRFLDLFQQAMQS